MPYLCREAGRQAELLTTSANAGEKNKEWLPVRVLNRKAWAKELSARDLNRYKKIEYLESEEGLIFSIQSGRFHFPTSIAKWTRSRLANNELQYYSVNCYYEN